MSLVQLRNDADDRAQLRSVCEWFADQHPFSDLSKAKELIQA